MRATSVRGPLAEGASAAWCCVAEELAETRLKSRVLVPRSVDDAATNAATLGDRPTRSKIHAVLLAAAIGASLVGVEVMAAAVFERQFETFEEYRNAHLVKGVIVAGAVSAISLLAIRAHRHAAKQLREHSEIERRASVAVLAESVTHDVRNLMTVAAGTVEFLQAVPDTSDVVPHLEAVQASCEGIADLCRALDALATSGHDADRTSFDVRDVVAGVIRVTSASRRCRTTRVSSVESSERIAIVGGRTALTAALTNLVLNAAAAGGEKGVVEIVVSTKPDGRATVAVHDNGPGVDADTRALLEHPGVPSGGKGLGLKGVAAAVCALNRSEERRVGKEGRSRWSPYH